LAVPKESIAVGSYNMTLIDRVRAASRDTFWRRLLVWGVLVLSAAWVVAVWVDSQSRFANHAVLKLAFALGICAGIGATIFFFTRFILTRALRFMLAAAAFSTLSGGVLVEAIRGFGGNIFVDEGCVVSASWVAFSVLICGAAHARSVLRSSNRIRSVTHCSVAAGVVLAFPVAALPYALDPSILLQLQVSVWGNVVTDVVSAASGVVAPALLAVALLGFHLRFSREHDRVSGMLCYFLVPCILGLAAQGAAYPRYTEGWVSAQFRFSVAWLVLVGGIAVENAFAHKEISDRIEEMEALREISWALVGTGTPRDLKNRLAETLREKLGMRITAIYLADESGESLVLEAVAGPEECKEAVGKSFHLESPNRYPGFHSGHTAAAYRTREPQIRHDVFVDVEFVPWRMVAVDNGCAASIPLLDGGSAAGVINVYYSNCPELTRQRLALLSTIAEAVTPALRRADAVPSDSSDHLDLAA